jgi:hypothetical protein
MECARKVLEMYSNLVTPEFVMGGEGVMGTHNFGILFYIIMMIILFFFLTQEFCEVCVFSLRTTHFTFGFPNENNQIWCLFAPRGGQFKIIEFTKKVGSVSK